MSPGRSLSRNSVSILRSLVICPKSTITGSPVALPALTAPSTDGPARTGIVRGLESHDQVRDSPWRSGRRRRRPSPPDRFPFPVPIPDADDIQERQHAGARVLDDVVAEIGEILPAGGARVDHGGDAAAKRERVGVDRFILRAAAADWSACRRGRGYRSARA